MKKIFKLTLILLLIIVLIATAFIYTFDANKYKDEVASMIGSMVNRPVTIKGDVDISLYPWIGIKLSDMSIDNNAGFSQKTLANIGQFDININILPLLKKRLEIDKLVLHRLIVNFEVNAQGDNNWSDFSSSSNNGDAGSEFGLAGLVIAGIELTDASINWLDVSSNKEFKISKISLNTEEIVQGKPLPISLKAFMESNQPEWMASISMTSELVFDEDRPIFQANNVKLKAKAIFPGEESKKISFAMITNSEVNFHEATAKLTKTKFSIFDLIVSGEFDIENIFSIPSIQGPLKIKSFKAEKLAKHFNIEIPAMSEVDSLKNISLSALFKTDFNTINLDDVLLTIDQTRISGFIHIDNLKKPVIRYALDADAINLNHYSRAPTDTVNNEIMLPLDFIRAIDLDGTFDIETLIVGDVELKDFHVTSRIKESMIVANPVTTWIGDSEVKAALSLDVRSSPQGKITLHAKNVDANSSLNPLLKAIMGNKPLILDGKITLDANINTKGLSLSAHKKSAKGVIKIDMVNGEMHGLDLDHASRKVVAEYANRNNFRTRSSYVPDYVENKKTEIKKLHATFKVANGKLKNNDLLISFEDSTITGSGSIDFMRDKLDYRAIVDIKVKSRIDVRDKLRDHPMEYQLSGDFKNFKNEFDLDKYELLVGRLLIQEYKRNRNKAINKKLKGAW